MPKCETLLKSHFGMDGLLSNFIEITLWYGCLPVNLLHIYRTPFTKSIFGRLFLFDSFQSIMEIPLYSVSALFTHVSLRSNVE